MNADNSRPLTVGEMMSRDDLKSKRQLVQLCAGILIAIGLMFTGTLSFLLYGRAFEGAMKVVAIIPALLIEGSLAMFLLGSFVWFSHGTQGGAGRRPDTHSQHNEIQTQPTRVSGAHVD